MSENGVFVPIFFWEGFGRPQIFKRAVVKLRGNCLLRRETTGLQERIVANCSGKKHVEQTLEAL